MPQMVILQVRKQREYLDLVFTELPLWRHERNAHWSIFKCTSRGLAVGGKLMSIGFQRPFMNNSDQLNQ